VNGSQPAQPPHRARKWWLTAVIAVGMIAIGLLFQPDIDPPPPPAPPTAAAPRVPPPEMESPPVEIVNHPVITAADRLLATDSAAEDLEIFALILADYRKALGGNPIGENEEIAACLLGENPKGLRFLPVGHPAIDSAGRLCDRWGTPLFFHALSSQLLTIRSAGPDCQHGTSDDCSSQSGAE
jgi:hypothetical protein